MSGLFRKRGWTGACLAILLAAWALGPLAPLLQPMLDLLAPAGEVAATRIDAPSQSRAVCHHHPEGCPKDCFCPKLPAPEQERAAAEHSGALHEPSLAHCTGKDSQRAEPALMVLVLPIPEAYSLPSGQEENLAPASSPLPASPCPEPPWKVPLA